MAEIEFDPTPTSPPAYKPAATQAQIDKALDLLCAAKKTADHAGGGIHNADAADLLQQLAEICNVPVIPTLMGWGAIPDDHPLMAGMAGLQTSHRYGNANLLDSDLVFGIGNRWANRHTGSVDKYTAGRKVVHIDIEPTQIGRVIRPDLGIVSDARIALQMVDTAKRRFERGELPNRDAWCAACLQRKQTLLRKTHFDNVPVKPQRVYEEMNRAFGRDACYVTTIGLSQIAAAQMLHVSSRVTGSTPGRPARWVGRCLRRWAYAPPIPSARWSRCRATMISTMIEELAVGAQSAALYPRAGEQRLSGADPPGAARVRYGLLRAAVV